VEIESVGVAGKCNSQQTLKKYFRLEVQSSSSQISLLVINVLGGLGRGGKSRLWPRSITLFGKAFWFFIKKVKALTNNSKHKALTKYSKLFSFLCHIITHFQPPKKQKAPSKFFYQTNPPDIFVMEPTSFTLLHYPTFSVSNFYYFKEHFL
jgi:hypothetical protein